MRKNDDYQYTEIRKNIWQIEEDHCVCCTLVKGSEKALLIDTGYGRRNLRTFIEQNLDTPYMVVNSHGHPDHIGGNHWFDTVLTVREELDVIRHFEEGTPLYSQKILPVKDRLSLGNLHITVIPLPGHTAGSTGFLVEEERLLIAGDALNEELWLFNYGSLSLKQLYRTLKQTLSLEFDSYLCGHNRKEYKKEALTSHIKNMEALKTDACIPEVTIGFETLRSIYEDASGHSEIVFTKDKLSLR